VSLKNSDTIVYNRDILILCRILGSKDDPGVRRKQISALFEGLNCTCGISNVFGSLWDIAAAYGQAHAAVMTGERLRLARKEDGSFRFYHYEDHYLNHLVANGIDSLPGVFTNSFAFGAIKTLKLYDDKHGTNLLETLTAYLKCERNATSASELLHVHRNTVLYHVRKIEDILDVSLDSPDARMKLMIGFKAFELDRI
ncbi:MAG: helix-turn-helix domain-containing protein, partial [Peptococcaceae bacterium]|jgi:sugar diacid utilization regulator|nr:helix-turn-helix domain-containing protein [Peptococcaceae bacterium]